MPRRRRGAHEGPFLAGRKAGAAEAPEPRIEQRLLHHIPKLRRLVMRRDEESDSAIGQESHLRTEAFDVSAVPEKSLTVREGLIEAVGKTRQRRM